MGQRNRPSSATEAAPKVIAATGTIVPQSTDSPREARTLRRMDLSSRVDLQIRRHLEAIEHLLQPRCTRCSHPLTKPASINRGMGPVCALLEA